MKILHQDARSNEIKLLPETIDDLWHMCNLVDEGDLVFATTFRRKEEKPDKLRPDRLDKVRMRLGIRVQKVDFHESDDMLRILGAIEEGPQDVGEHHTLMISIGEALSIIKPEWRTAHFDRIKRAVASSDKPWIVYAKRPFAGPRQVLDYLGRYTHRVAISNHRILSLDDGRVTFSYRDRRDHNLKKQMSLDAHEFIRRFLLHVLPPGFMKIRHFGFLANPCKADNLKRIRLQLGESPLPDTPQPPAETVAEMMLRITGIDITRCPHCQQGHLVRSERP